MSILVKKNIRTTQRLKINVFCGYSVSKMAPNRDKTEILSTLGKIFFGFSSESPGQTTLKNRNMGGPPTQDHVVMINRKSKVKNLRPRF